MMDLYRDEKREHHGHEYDFDFGLITHLKGASVLVIDDSCEGRTLIGRYLRDSGAEVDVAVNGLEGIKQALVGNYDVLLMDIQMPRLDGLEATRKLREWGYDGSIVAVTAHSRKAEKDDCLEAGCDDYLVKPISRMQLLYTVASRPRLRGYQPKAKPPH